MTESAEGPAPEAPGPDSALGRLVGAFAFPARTFRAIARRPTWLLPLLVWTAMSFLVAELVVTRSDWRTLIRERVEKRGQKLSEAQLDQIAERSHKFSWIGELVAVLAPGIVAAATAGGLWAACEAFGLELRFAQSFGVTVHAFLPHALAAVALFGVLWGRSTIDPTGVDDALPTSLGFLVRRASAPALHSLLSSVDLISLWTMVLLVLGFSEATKATRGRIAALVLSLWALYVLGKAGLSALTS